MKRKSSNLTIILGMACIVLIVALLYVLALGKSKPENETTTLTSEVLEAAFKDIGELATHECDLTMIEKYENSKKLFGRDLGITKKSFLYSYNVIIKAGINFDEIKVDVQEEKKSIRITIPEAGILSTEILEDSFQMYDEKNNIFNPIKVEDMNAANSDLKKKAVSKAESGDFLVKARENAQILIENMISEIPGTEDYTIVIK